MHFKTNAFARRSARVGHLATGASLLGGVVMALMPQTMRAQRDPRVLANFATGAMRSQSVTGTTYYTQTGTGIVGGTRNINLVINTANVFVQPVQVRPQPEDSATPSALIMSAGFQAFPEAGVYYLGSATESLDLNLVPYNRFRATFAGLVGTVDFAFEVADSTGNYAAVTCFIGPFSGSNVDGSGFTITTLDIPEASLTSPGTVDWSNIKEIYFSLGPANSLGLTSFAITGLSAIMATDPVGTVTCPPGGAS
jgi:hypothetical protein